MTCYFRWLRHTTQVFQLKLKCMISQKPVIACKFGVISVFWRRLSDFQNPNPIQFSWKNTAYKRHHLGSLLWRVRAPVTGTPNFLHRFNKSFWWISKQQKYTTRRIGGEQRWKPSWESCTPAVALCYPARLLTASGAFIVTSTLFCVLMGRRRQVLSCWGESNPFSLAIAAVFKPRYWFSCVRCYCEVPKVTRLVHFPPVGISSLQGSPRSAGVAYFRGSLLSAGHGFFWETKTVKQCWCKLFLF